MYVLDFIKNAIVWFIPFFIGAYSVMSNISFVWLMITVVIWYLVMHLQFIKVNNDD